MNTDLEPSAESRIDCLGELGRGETTIVELIHDRDRQATFARKRWPRTSAELRFRLKQQFRRAQAIEHRNLVRLYELDAAANETSLTMEAVSGSDVVAHMQALAQAGCDDSHYIAVAVDVLRQLTEALVTLHAGGLVHRDVKPRNVLIEPSGRVVLLDAGFAWPPQQHFDPQRDRMLAATLPYLAPECLRGALPSEEADWYSFGALASELLTGRAPFSGSLDAVLRAKDAPFSTLREASPAVPELLDEMVCALLIRDPSARPTAIEVQEVMAEIAADYRLWDALAADGGGEVATESGTVELAAAEAEALPSIAAPAVSMVVGPSGEAAALALDVELARSAGIPALELEPDNAANPTLGADANETAPQLMAAESLEPALEPAAIVETILDELERTATPNAELAAVSQAQTLEDARAQRSAPLEQATQSAASLSQAQTLEDARAQRSTQLEPSAASSAHAPPNAEAELLELETLTAFDLAPAPPASADLAADALGLDLATELRDALVSGRIVDVPEVVAPAAVVPETRVLSAWNEQQTAPTASIQRVFDSAISPADVDVLETLDRVFDDGAQSTPASPTPDPSLEAAIAALIESAPITRDEPDAISAPNDVLLAEPSAAEHPRHEEIEQTDETAPEPPIAADGGNDRSADPWLQRALEPTFARGPSAAPAREPSMNLALEQARASSSDALPKVSAQRLAAHEDPSGRFTVPDACLELALNPAEPLARVDTESTREPWATLTLEPLDALPPLTTDDAESDRDRDSWRALEPHELPEPLRDPGFPALPLYDDDDDPALELAEARPSAIGLLAALQLTAANDTPPAEAPPLMETKAESTEHPSDAVEPTQNTPRRSPTADLRTARLEQRLRDDQPQLVLLRGDAGTGKTELLEELLQGLTAPACPRTIITCNVAPASGAAFETVRALIQRVLPIAERCTFTLSAESAAALRVIFPALQPHLSEAATPALDLQRRWIDAVLGLRAFFRQLTAEHPLLIAIDDAHRLDLDSAHLLRALLAVAPLPNATWLLTQRADCELPLPLTAAIAPSHGETRLPIAIHDMDPLRSSRLSLPPIVADEPAETEDAATLIAEAEAAADALALQRAADLHTRALRAASTPTLAQLEAAATALARAGRLREASETWLSAARQTRDPLQAQRFELNAGAALLRAGDEDGGREQLQSVLKICELTWPRAPLLTSTLERARMLLQSHRPRIPVQDAELRRRRFDALWHSAKELVLVAPVTGDALSVRALREALMLGDASRLAWALGYEAVSAANIGGNFMRRRASTLVGEMRALAQQSGTAFDTAYARSVEAAVAFLSGDWYDAEQLLRTALIGFARAPEPTAHEEHVVGTFLVSALEAQGKLEALTELLPDLQLMAAETGHYTAHALYALAEAGLPALARDRALEAIAGADAVLAELGGESFSSLHFQHFVATASARLYAGHYAQAFQQVEQTWQRVRHTYLPQLDAVSVMLHQLRARAALALAKQSSVHEAERLVKHATKLANELAGSSLPHALALRHVIDANLALLRGRTAQADAHCWQASQCFEGAGMTLMSEVARHARAALAETSEAQADAARCRAYFARIGIVRPSAFTGAWFPVFGN